MYCRRWVQENHPGTPPVRLPINAIEVSDDVLVWAFRLVGEVVYAKEVGRLWIIAQAKSVEPKST